MSCYACKEAEATCDDYCFECEVAFFRANPDEQPHLILQVESDPDWFAAWVPVVKALQEAA